MQWSHPVMQGALPPPCKGHTATAIERRVFVFGGGRGQQYYDTLYYLVRLSTPFVPPLLINFLFRIQSCANGT